MDSVYQLKQLQNIDDSLSEIRSYLGDLPLKVDELKSKEIQLNTELESGKDRLRRIEIELKKIEGDLIGSKEKIDSLKDQLFKVSNNRQYDALMVEIDHLKELIDKMETTDLELLEEKSQLTEKVKVQEENLDELTVDLSVRRKKLESTIAESGDRKKILEEERKNKRDGIPSTLLIQYDRILKAKKGLAVVPVNGKACEGCGSTIPPQIIAYVRTKTNLYNCDVCGRFLFWEDQSTETKS
ncbi:MAG: C4-type zinc ribbon domain-containing protein [Candidatus Marinimicrobia bacterium]|jgi:predicted  nucleic acid-binding Zn-ribbon protein|nr:C4-type zinc ribbon domain-containing protein [Candidatus Neomarinimicrobiota bacterium]